MIKYTVSKALREEKQHRQEKEIPSRFPRQVSSEQFGILKKLKARIDMANIDNNLFLGYCTLHQTYYVDHKHTNGEIRCPTCEKKWFTSPSH